MVVGAREEDWEGKAGAHSVFDAGNLGTIEAEEPSKRKLAVSNDLPVGEKDIVSGAANAAFVTVPKAPAAPSRGLKGNGHGMTRPAWAAFGVAATVSAVLGGRRDGDGGADDRGDEAAVLGAAVSPGAGINTDGLAGP